MVGRHVCLSALCHGCFEIFAEYFLFYVMLKYVELSRSAALEKNEEAVNCILGLPCICEMPRNEFLGVGIFGATKQWTEQNRINDCKFSTCLVERQM